jgi:hypothetical protein
MANKVLQLTVRPVTALAYNGCDRVAAGGAEVCGRRGPRDQPGPRQSRPAAENNVDMTFTVKQHCALHVGYLRAAASPDRGGASNHDGCSC